MHRTIEVIVTPTGEVTVEAVGFQGKACKQATEAIEKALGLAATPKLKPEYHQQTTTTARQKT